MKKGETCEDCEGGDGIEDEVRGSITQKAGHLPLHAMGRLTDVR